MKNIYKVSVVMVLVVSFILGITGLTTIFAATSPSLGTAATYGVLSDTYTNPLGPTTINGDIGFTTGPAVLPLGGHPSVTYPNYGLAAPYSTAGTDQALALVNLNSQTCTYTFPSGDIDLATDMTHVTAGYGSAIGEYYPGVYCTAGAASALSVGTAGITLTDTGAGTYIFRNDGALNTVASSHITLSGASACDVFWTPNGPTTLNHDSTFKGTIIPILAATHDITIYDGVVWIGRALTFGHTVTTLGADAIITVPMCTPPELTLVKTITNDNGGTRTVTDFPLMATGTTSITGVSGTVPITSAPVTAGTYTLSETTQSDYTAGLWSCVKNGSGAVVGNSITLVAGDSATCTINNNDIPPQLHLRKLISGGTATVANFTLTANGTGLNDISGTSPVDSGTGLLADTFALSETNLVSYTASAWVCVGGVQSGSNITVGINQSATCTITNTYTLPIVSSGGGGGGSLRMDSCPNGDYSPSYYDGICGTAPIVSSGSVVIPTVITQAVVPVVVNTGSVAIPIVVYENAPAVSTNSTPNVLMVAPYLPHTGLAPKEKSIPWNIAMLAGVLMIVSSSLFVIQKKWTV